METNEERVSLVNLMGGAVVESFDEEFQKVLNNIMDPNTDPKALREVTIKIKIKPTENRDFAPVGIQVKRTLAPTADYNTQKCALFEADGGRWKLNAIYLIRDWLRERLPDIAIIA